jgi:hypothetical protein
MTHEEIIALWGSALTFVGGGFLVVDAFSPVREFLHMEGTKKYERLVAQLESKLAAATTSGSPLKTPPAAVPAKATLVPNDREAYDAARRSQFLVRTGFFLVAAGFLLDLIAKLHLC